MNNACKTAQSTLVNLGIDALIVGPGPDMTALIGWKTHPMERLICTIIPAVGKPVVIVPQMEVISCKASLNADVDVQTWGENLGSWDIAANFLATIPNIKHIAFDNQLWSQNVLKFQSLLPADTTYSDGEIIMDKVRVVKDEVGIAGLRAAGAAIDRVHLRMGEVLKVGRTEAEVARDIDVMMKEEGHDEADFIIVAAGPNGAAPHHRPTDRVIKEGDAVVVDIGGPCKNWFSDCTRNYVMGHAPEGYDEAFAVLKKAQQTGVNAVKPGVPCGSIDKQTSQVIIDAGYGDFILHRTGHGIGLAVHENPYIFEPNQDLLEPGMAFSVEPGIYKEGEWGMRIEDIVWCTADGVERLNVTDIDYVVL